MNLEKDVYIDIVKYTGVLPVINPTLAELALYLDPRNKSNNSLDKDQWKDYNNRYTGTLSNMHYGNTNGWLIDSAGINYLGLSSGAKFELNDFRPFLKDPTKVNDGDTAMGYGMTIELDFEINGVLNYESELISCVSRNDGVGAIRTGFIVTGDKATLYSSSGALVSLNLVEGKRTRVSFVVEGERSGVDFPMAYGYLDGKISSAIIYGSTDSFNDTVEAKAFLNIDATNAQIKIYSIRIYNTALNDSVILNNYTASLNTLEERQIAYDSNNVYNAVGKIDLNKVMSEDYDLQIPYMILTGGWATEAESKWKLRKQTNANVGLPTGKKDYRMVDVKVVYPKNNSYFANYEDYEFVNHFSEGKTMATAYGEEGGSIMYAQGTSSMEYPVKNLRLRFRRPEHYYTVRPDIAPVEIICMKADYMESSGSHNTGAANLVDDLYDGQKMQTPGQKHFGGEGKDTIVTCIKGHPCLIFYSPDGNDYEYIGKYNLNLDKATPEPFGFDHDDSDFGYLRPGDSYYDILYNDEDEYVEDQIEQQKEVQEGNQINAIHCFEFLDNAVEVCNFLGKAQYE